MSPRQKALAVSSPTLGVLVLTIVWNAVEYRWVDRTIRWLDLRG